MRGYRRIGDRRGRLRFEIIGRTLGELDTTALRQGGHNNGSRCAPPDGLEPRSPGSAERARPSLDGQTGLAPGQTGRGSDTAHSSATVQLLDISMSGALLASPCHLEVGSHAKLRTVLGEEPFVVEVRVQHVRSAVTNPDKPAQLGVMFVSHDDLSLGCIQRFLNSEGSQQ